MGSCSTRIGNSSTTGGGSTARFSFAVDWSSSDPTSEEIRASLDSVDDRAAARCNRLLFRDPRPLPRDEGVVNCTTSWFEVREVVRLRLIAISPFCFASNVSEG